MDYGFLGSRGEIEDEGVKDVMKVMVVKGRKDQAYAFEPVKEKGIGDGYAERTLRHIMNEWGCKSVNLRSDNEEAMKSLKQEVKERRTEETYIEEVPRGITDPTGKWRMPY